MSAEPLPPSESGPLPFTNASPAQIRAALIPEEVESFDRDWRVAMTAATEAFDLSVVRETLNSWRRHAVLTTARGHDGYRKLIATAEHTLRTGELPPGTSSIEEVKAAILEGLS